MSSELSSYFERLRSSLQLGPEAEDDVVRELRAHAEDRLAELENAGLSAEDAQRTLLSRLGRPRALAREYQLAHLQASWHDALTAAAAFLLVAALYATHLWSSPPALLAVASIIVAVTLYGLWQGRPSWFYPWAGLALTLLSFCGYLAFVLLQRAAGMIADGHVAALPLLGFGGALAYFPLAVIILASCIRAASRRDWIDASLMLSPSAPVVVWLAVLHESGGVPEGATSVVAADAALAATFLSMALAAAVFVRVGTRTLRLATVLATAALAVFAASSIYDSQLSLATLSGRTLLLFGFLLSPAALEALAMRPLRDPPSGH